MVRNFNLIAISSYSAQIKEAYKVAEIIRSENIAVLLESENYKTRHSAKLSACTKIIF
jgi:hypothetical protein